MKPSFALPVGAALASVLLSGCGQPGPLYMPPPPKPPPASTAPAAPAPVEKPADSSPAPAKQ